MPDRTPRWLTIAVAVVVLGLVGWSLLGGGDTTEGDEASAVTSTLVDSTDLPPPTSEADPGDVLGSSGLAVTFVDALPPEAMATLDLIAEGGPFPYPQDGSTFFNREGLLPEAPEGFYAEYTVETPGSPDRGARRLVVSDDGQVFYTSDHYASFDEVVDASL